MTTPEEWLVQKYNEFMSDLSPTTEDNGGDKKVCPNCYYGNIQHEFNFCPMCGYPLI